MRLSRDPAARRRLVLLAVAAAAALVLGAALGAHRGSSGGTPAPRERGPGAAARGPAAAAVTPAVDRLTLAQQVGQTVILRFTGTSAPEYVLRALRERRAAGVILFRDNVVSPVQLRRLTGALRAAAGGRLLVCVDQEGGAVRIVAGVAPVLGQGAQPTPAAAEDEAHRAARDLRADGIDVTLAPVADVAAGGGGALAGRTFPGAAPDVARFVTAAVRGYAGSGVAATAKHFPGLGAARANTDDAPVTVGEPAGRIAADLASFRAAIAAGVPLVMASHALYPALDRERIASQSPTILVDLLRRRLGFGGAVITDSLEARAVTARSPVGVAGLRSLRAGADLLLTTGRGSFLPVTRSVLAAARSSAEVRARVREAAVRVLELERRVAFAPGAGG